MSATMRGKAKSNRQFPSLRAARALGPEGNRSRCAARHTLNTCGRRVTFRASASGWLTTRRAGGSAGSSTGQDFRMGASLAETVSPRINLL